MLHPVFMQPCRRGGYLYHLNIALFFLGGARQPLKQPRLHLFALRVTSEREFLFYGAAMRFRKRRLFAEATDVAAPLKSYPLPSPPPPGEGT